MIYYFIWGIVALLMLIGYYNKTYRVFTCFLIILIVTLFAGFRYERWSDWDSYYDIFIHAGNVDRDVEYGFKLLCQIGNFLLKDYNLFLCVIYAIVFTLHYLEYKDSVPSMTTFCLFVFMSVSLLTSGGMREFIAVGITHYSVRFIRKKNIKKFLITVIVAAFFHRTALFFIPAFWIDKLKLHKKRVIIFTIICILLGSFGAFRHILTFITPLFNRFPSFAYRIRLYTYTIDDLKILNLSFIKRTLLLVLSLFVSYRKQINGTDEYNRKKYINIYTVGYFISILVPGQFARISGYYSVAEPIIESFILLNVVKSKNRSLLLLFFVIMYLANWINILNTFYPDLLIPYRSVLFN